MQHDSITRMGDSYSMAKCGHNHGMNTTTTTRTSGIFAAMENDPRWLGYGYLGERRNCFVSRYPADIEVAALDSFILERTTDWTDEELFAWANSKNGRWTADLSFGCDELDARYIVKVATR